MPCDPLHTLSGPSALHWLGTDELGRDTWSRALYGGRTDLQVGVLAVIFPFCFGVFIGTVCGYFGGRLDTIVMRVVDVVLAFPFYVLIIALVFVVGVGTHGIYIAFGLTDWVVYARTTQERDLGRRATSTGWPPREGGGLSRGTGALAPHPPQHHHPGDRLRRCPTSCIVILAVVTLGYLGLGIQPPGARLGIDDLRRSELPPKRSVDGGLPGHRGRVHRHRPVAARRRPRGRVAARMTPFLEVEDLVVEMRRHGAAFRAVNGVSFSLERGAPSPSSASRDAARASR